MKKYFILALAAVFLASFSSKLSASEDILFINLQYIVGQSKAGSSLREQSEELNSEIIKLRDEITTSLQEKGKKLEDERTLLSPEVFQERADELRKEAEEKQNELNVRLQKIQQAIQRASSIPNLQLVGTAKNKSSICSFVVVGVHPNDLGTLLDQQGVAIRSGHHCAMPLMSRLKVPGTARASFAFYNSLEDVDRVFDAIEKALFILSA